MKLVIISRALSKIAAVGHTITIRKVLIIVDRFEEWLKFDIAGTKIVYRK